MAIEKTVTINVDGKRAVKSLEELGGTFEDVYGEMQPLNTQIGELEDRLYEMSLRGEQGTKEFKDLTSQVGKMRKTIIDTDLAIDGMSQNMSQATTGAVMGVASGFELAQGSMAAFGVEGEQVEATLLKVQSAMAISQGLQGIREAIPSFKNLAAQVSMFGGNVLKSVKALGAFQKAMIATGIGAIIAGVGLLVANWDKLTKAIGGTSEAQETHNEVVNRAVEAASEELYALDKLSETLNNETISREDKVKAVKNLQKEYPSLLENIDAEKASQDEVNASIEKYNKLVMLRAQAEAIAELRQETFKKKTEEAVKAQTAQNVSYDDAAESLATWDGLYQAFSNTEEAAAKTRSIANKESLEEIKNLNKKEEILKGLEEEYKSQIEAMENEMGVKDKNTEATKRATQANKEEKKSLEDLRKERNAQIESISNLQMKDLSFEKQKQEEKKNIIARGFAQIAKISAEQREKEKIAREAARKKELEDEMELQDKKYTLASQSLSGINDLVIAFAGENEKAQERAFKISKAINIAQAVMDTYKGANAIFANAAANPSTILFPAQPFIAAGAAVAAGLANVATIAKQKFQGGSTGVSGGGGGVTAPNLGGGNAGSNPATFNVVGNTGNNQLAQTLGSTPMKAYVVSGDVSTAQALERNKIEQSSL